MKQKITKKLGRINENTLELARRYYGFDRLREEVESSKEHLEKEIEHLKKPSVFADAAEMKRATLVVFEAALSGQLD